MKKLFLLFFVLYIQLSYSQEKQNYLGKSFFVNLTGTYISEPDPFYHDFKEYTISTQMAVSFTNSIYGGVQTNSIFSRDMYTDYKFNKMFGVFVQYDMLPLLVRKDLFPQVPARFFFEGSINYGDYCTCGIDNPITKEGIFYRGIGGGLDYRFFGKRYGIYLAFVTYQMINRYEKEFLYNIYKVGVTYFFGKGR